jgi:hypothetical protein
MTPALSARISFEQMIALLDKMELGPSFKLLNEVSLQYHDTATNHFPL